jgi:hypothetical protein
MSDHPPQHDFDDELLSAYLDDELAADQRALVEARLAADPAARQMLDELCHVSQTIRGLPHEAPRHDLRDRVLRQVDDAKHQRLRRYTIGRTRRAWFWASLAVAAALLLMFVQREPRDDENARSVAQRRREPASLSAAPDATHPSRPQPAELAEAQPVPAPRAAGAAAAGTAAAGRAALANDRDAESLAEQPPPADDDPLVVVHVLAKRAAL